MDVLVYKSRHHYLENVYFQSPNNFQVHFYSSSGIFSRLMGLFSKVYSITSKILMFSPNLTPNDVKPPVSRENTQPESNPQPPGLLAGTLDVVLQPQLPNKSLRSKQHLLKNISQIVLHCRNKFAKNSNWYFLAWPFFVITVISLLPFMFRVILTWTRQLWNFAFFCSGRFLLWRYIPMEKIELRSVYLSF